MYAPVKNNLWFFFWMYLLGMACVLLVLRTGKHRTPVDLFLDLYVLCALLMIIPRRIRGWVRALLYVIFYGLALIDVFCCYRLGGPIGPSLLQNVLQTNPREASEALSTYVTWQSICTPVLVIVALLVAHIVATVCRARCNPSSALGKWLHWQLPAKKEPIAGAACFVAAVLSIFIAWQDKRFLYYNICKADTNLEMQYYLQKFPTVTEFYLPVYRLLHAVNVVRISQNEIETLVERADEVKVDSCSFRSPNIVLVIGESYNRHHAAVYGYDKPTTPWQSAMANDSSMVFFTDVVAPFHQTSEVFKLAFSLYAYGEKGSFTDYPLFPQLFLKAGYHVTFITNQYVQSPIQNTWDFGGSNIINEPTLSRSQFSDRNTDLHDFDEDLLTDYDSLSTRQTDHNLIIFHLMGQHVNYNERYPAGYDRFHAADYNRPDLTEHEREILSEYDNSTLYNDEVMRRIVSLFADKDAIVIYVPDHGEMMFDHEGSGEYGESFGRTMDVTTDSQVRQQFEIPFWIWMSAAYRNTHPDIYQQVREARDKPFMTDNLDMLLLGLAGISCPDYRPDDDLLNPSYNPSQPRMLMGTLLYKRQ